MVEPRLQLKISTLKSGKTFSRKTQRTGILIMAKEI